MVVTFSDWLKFLENVTVWLVNDPVIEFVESEVKEMVPVTLLVFDTVAPDTMLPLWSVTVISWPIVFILPRSAVLTVRTFPAPPELTWNDVETPTLTYSV